MTFLSGQESMVARYVFLWSLQEANDGLIMQGAHWTLDMASMNDAILQALGKLYLLCQPQVSFDAKNCCVLCFPHVINICFQCTITSLNRATRPRDSGNDDDAQDADTNRDSGDRDTDTSDNDADSLESGGEDEGNSDDSNNGNDHGSVVKATGGLLGKVHKLIWGICASGQQQQALNKVIIGGNQCGWWTGTDNKPITLKPKKLILDVHTHWDSTYLMLTCLLEFHQVHNPTLLLFIAWLSNTH